MRLGKPGARGRTGDKKKSLRNIEGGLNELRFRRFLQREKKASIPLSLSAAPDKKVALSVGGKLISPRLNKSRLLKANRLSLLPLSCPLFSNEKRGG